MRLKRRLKAYFSRKEFGGWRVLDPIGFQQDGVERA
jgi:hypothetical protein